MDLSIMNAVVAYWRLVKDKCAGFEGAAWAGSFPPGLPCTENTLRFKEHRTSFLVSSTICSAAENS